MTIHELADMMRLGAMLRPQCKHILFDRGGSCAIGAAIEAFDGAASTNVSNALANLLGKFPLQDIDALCPTCGDEDNLFEIIGSHLNDKHGWTREAIADWIETLEPQEMPHEEPAVAAATVTAA